MSLRETIFAAIEATVTAACPLASVERMPSGDMQPGTEIAIFDGPMRRVSGEVGSVRREISFRIEGSVAGGDGAEAHAALNTLHAAVVDCLIADPTLGDLVEWIEDGEVNFDLIPLADLRGLFFSQNFTVQFSAPRGLLS